MVMGGGKARRTFGSCCPALMNEVNACCWPSPPFFYNMAISEAIARLVVWLMDSRYTYESSFNAKFMWYSFYS